MSGSGKVKKLLGLTALAGLISALVRRARGNSSGDVDPQPDTADKSA